MLTDIEDSHQSLRSRSRRRARRLMVLTAVLCVILGPYVQSRFSSFGRRIQVFDRSANNANLIAAGQLESGPGKIRVMTWNIAHGRGLAATNWQETGTIKAKRILEIAGLIRQYSPDVVVLNEVDFRSKWSGNFDQADALASAAGYPYFARQCNLDFGIPFLGFRFGNVILSRFPITDAKAVDLPPYRSWEDWLAGRKRGLTATLDLGESRQIEMMAHHWESRGAATRIESALHVINEVQECQRPVILAGDLNSTPTDDRIREPEFWGYNREQKENAFDVFVSRSGLQPSPKKIVDSSQFTFPADGPQATIDWVFFSPEYFRVVQHQVPETDLSDHLPVVVDLAWKKLD